MKRKLHETGYSQMLSMDTKAREAAYFLVKNPQVVLDPDICRQWFTQFGYTETPIRSIVSHFIQTGKLAHVAFLYLGKTQGIPELLVMPNITLDTAQVTSMKDIVKYSQSIANKVLIDVTPFATKRGDDIIIRDTQLLYERILRAYLVMLDNDPNFYYPAVLQVPILETFSKIFTMIIAQNLRLDNSDMQIARTMLALYYARMMDRSNNIYPPIMSQLTYLGDVASVRRMINDCSLCQSNDFTLTDMALAMKELGSSRMKSLQPEFLYRHIMRIVSDMLYSSIMLEYPPYWVNQMILSVSQYKVPMSMHLKTTNLVDPVKKFAKQFTMTVLQKNIER